MLIPDSLCSRNGSLHPSPGGKLLLVISGTVVINFSSGQSSGWRRDTIRILPDFTGPFTYAGNDPTANAVVFQAEQYSTFASLNAIFDQSTSVNAGFAVDAFRPYFIDGGRGLTTGSGIDVDIAVQDIDATLYRVGYELTAVGTFSSVPFLDAPDSGLRELHELFSQHWLQFDDRGRQPDDRGHGQHQSGN